MFIPIVAVYTTAWLAGVLLAPILPQLLWAWLALAAVAGLAALRVGWRRPALAALFFCLGVARWGWAQPVPDDSYVTVYADQGQVTVEGFVVDEPDVRDTLVNLRVQVDSLQPQGAPARPVHGLLLVQAPRYPAWQYGDRLRINGDLVTPPVFEDFSYKDYLARSGVAAILRRASPRLVLPDSHSAPPLLAVQAALLRPLFALKARALAAIAAAVPEPQGSLLSGVLLGEAAGLPDYLVQAFRATGTSHILAISGFNVTIVIKVVQTLLQRLWGPGRRTRLAMLAGIVVYSLMTGASASVVRAALMGALVVMADGFDRQVEGLASLAVAAFLMTLYNPEVMFDVGFQLSAGATLGLVLYADPLQKLAARLFQRAWPWLEAASESLLLTVAAQLTTLPLMAYYFHQVSLISLLANLLVLPAQPPLMIMGGLAMLGGMLHPFLGAALYWLAWPFLSFTILVVETLARVPLAAVMLDRFSAPALLLPYGLLLALTVAGQRRPAWLANWRVWAAVLGLGALAIGAAAAWNAYLGRPDGRLHITFLNVGDGQAVLIQTPAGRYALVDGGPSPNGLAESLGRTLPTGARALDLVLVTSSEAGSLAGLPGLFDRYDIALAAQPAGAFKGPAYQEWAAGLSARQVRVNTIEAGQQFDLGGGALLSLVDARPTGLSVRIDYGRAGFLLPLGLDAESASAVAQAGRIAPATVLLAPHGAGPNALSAFLMDAAQPRAVVISSAPGRVADPQTLALFAGRTVLNTADHGAITFITDGGQLWIETER